jgi:hypothetical protein
MVNDVTLTPEAASRREDARLEDGKFGEYVLGEVDLDLDPQPTWTTDHLPHEVLGWAQTIRLAFQRRSLNRVLDETQRRSEQRIADPEAAAVEEGKRSWHRRFLNLMLRYTAPPGHFTLRRTLTNSFTAGAIAMGSIMSFAVPAEYMSEHGLGVREDAPYAAPRWEQEYDILAAEYACSSEGLPEGVIAVHALVLDKTAEPEPEVRLVSFDRGWKIHQAEREDLVLVGVCAK